MKLWLGSALLVILGLGSVSSQDDGGCAASGQTPYDYSQALCMSILFYEAQRSGPLPPDQRVTWRGDSALQDGADNGVDLTGGYYDAGDYVKFGFPHAYTVTVLAWGLIAYPNGYQKAGQTDYARAAIRWGAEYLLKAKTGPTELYGQVGDPEDDHAYWGRPEEMTMARPSWKIDAANPGTDLAAETAAALAATSIVFKDSDPSFSAQCLAAARELYSFAADQNRLLYQLSITEAAAYYASYSYEDELPWGALWMYKATGEQSYLDAAIGFINEFGILYYAEGMGWDDKRPGIYALVSELDGSQVYIDKFTEYVDYLLVHEHTPLGLIYMGEWGSLRSAMGVTFIALRAASLGINSASYEAWAQQQVDYALGSTGRSFVVGFGVNPPTHPHHRSSSCPDQPAPCDGSYAGNPAPSPQTLFGALVGGPDANDVYVDDREDYVHNEVACDYNGLFVGCLARLTELH